MTRTARKSDADATPAFIPASEAGPPSTSAPPSQQAPAASRGAERRREAIRNAALWITISALSLSVLTFLISVNSIITIWFREQWAPVARAVMALVIVYACIHILVRIGRRGAAKGAGES